MAIIYTDQDIRQNVWDEISHDVRIDPSNITVRVVDGVVYLDGTVPTYSQKLTAAEDARRIKGVVDVVNNLQVRLTGTWSDDQIRETVRLNLDTDSRITDPGKVHVTVHHGVVTLTGTVPNYGQRQASEDDAWIAPGVIDVVDDIIVEPPTRRSDEENPVDVCRALDTDPGINAARITVDVVDGTVYLRGSVPTYYQIGLAADDAWSVPGVRNVVNELTVE